MIWLSCAFFSSVWMAHFFFFFWFCWCMWHWFLNLRSDLESVLVAIFDHLFKQDNSDPISSLSKDGVGILLDAAVFTKHEEGSAEECMSFQEFRSWCNTLPSVRKFLGSLLMPPDPGINLCFMCWVPVWIYCMIYIFVLWSYIDESQRCINHTRIK